MNVIEEIKKFPYVLAPLAGYTDHPLRALSRQYGASLVFTEMINVHSMVKNRVKIHQMLFYSGEEKPVGIQLFGNDTVRFHDAAQAAEEMGFDLVDINFGCPVNKVTRAYGGAYLHKDLPAVEATIKAVVQAVKKIPVSIKMRSGWDLEHINFLDIAKIAGDNGVTIITLHPRTRAQMFTGHSNWEHIRELKLGSKCFIIGNGDVVDRASALKMKQETGCDAVMIGRAAIGNPFIFKQISEPGYKPASKELYETAIKHLEMLWVIAGRQAALEIRKYYKHYIKDFAGAADARRALMTMTDKEEITGYIRRLMEGADRQRPV